MTTAQQTTAQRIFDAISYARDGWWYHDDLEKRGVNVNTDYLSYDGTVTLEAICLSAGAIVTYKDGTGLVAYCFDDWSAIVEGNGHWGVRPDDNTGYCTTGAGCFCDK